MDNDDEILDAFDPVRRTYRAYLLKLKVAGTVLGMVLLASTMAGVPHLQTGYRLYDPRPVGREPVAAEKSEGTYLGPLGRRVITDGQYGQRGCPMLVLVPLFDCLGGGELKRLSSSVSELLASEGDL